MAKNSTRFVCQECGATHRKWSGKCDVCGAWNSIVEEASREVVPKGLKGSKGHAVPFVALDGKAEQPIRLTTRIGELDRVCGGGLVPGSAILIGGDPGIGKSTLVLQAAAALSVDGTCVYISGEESIEQIRLRADRLGLRDAPVHLAAATSVRDIVTTLDAADTPRVVIIDSIQTMFVDSLDSAPGTVAQVRASAQELIRLAKRRGFSVLLIGHVTKEGAIAGPKVLEHMVDTVLYFEGERGHQFRLLRAIKNRFGPTDEIGVFEMTGRGLIEIDNPSELFLADRREDMSGAAVFAGIEGTRPVLVEIQALVAPSALGTPRRAVIGWDAGRLAMVLAVLEARCGVGFAGRDVYLNVAGGLKITEPAADLAVAAALISAGRDIPAPADAVVFGEIGLSGEVRGVGQAAQRRKEAHKLGFQQVICPSETRGTQDSKRRGSSVDGLQHNAIGSLRDLVALFDRLDAPPSGLREVGPS